MQGETLVATCRRVDGAPERSSLPAVHNCVGDIGNVNGRLGCSYAHARTPQPYYGGTPGAYGQEWEGRREHCGRMRERLREIRYRMQDAPPWGAIGWARGCTKSVSDCGMNVGVTGGKTNKLAATLTGPERRNFSSDRFLTK